MLKRFAAALGFTLIAGAVQAQNFSFGLWGDMPYEKAGDEARMPAILASINASPIAFSVFVGDIKDGSSKCTDEVFSSALAMFDAMSAPLIYVPGDNEWTDCHRLNNGSYDPLERLNHLRRKMFDGSASLGQSKIALEDQAATSGLYVENKRWQKNAIVFVSFNIPGSNNNKVLNAQECTFKSARTWQDCEQANAEYAARDAANIEWLRLGFQQARSVQARGIVLAFQGDPGFDLPETEELDESKLPNVSGYQSFLQRVVQETEAFEGQVLLVHGDTHFFKVDKPLYSPTRILPNLTRLQTFGSPGIHWVKVNVDFNRPSVFDVEPMLVRQPAQAPVSASPKP